MKIRNEKTKILIKEIRLLFTTEISTEVIAKSTDGDPDPDVLGLRIH
jgi:hypothetical protein